MTQRIFLLIVIILVTLALGLFLPYKWLGPVLHYSGYYFILTAFFLWLALILKISYDKFDSFVKNHYPAILLSVGLMCLIFHAHPPKFKILADEANLIGVSMAMHEDKTTSLPIQGLALDYSVFNYTHKLDKRPLLFPFLVSLFHAALGYSPYNGYVVNFLLGIFILLLFYLLINDTLSKFYSIVGMILMASYPIFIFWVTSSGFDTLNLFFILFVFYALYNFLKSQSIDHAELLFISLILLAQCRYESMLFFLSLIIFAACFLNRNIFLKYRLTSYIFPLFLLPVIWQRRFFLHNSEPVRIGYELYEKTGHMFDLTNLINNFSKNIFVLSGMDCRFGFLPIVSIFAIIGIYLLIKKYFLSSMDVDSSKKKVIILGLISIVSLFLIHSSYYWGNYTRPVANRFALILVPFFIFGALYFVCYLLKRPSKYVKIVITLIACVQLLYYWPVANKQWITKGLSLTYEYERVTNYLHSTYNIKNENILIISDLPNLYVIHNVGAIDFNRANQNLNKIKFYHQTYYDHVIVFQRCDMKNDQTKQRNVLKKNFHLKELKRINISPNFYIKISELKKIS